MVLCHPDKFAGAATFEQRAAAKRAADVNEAYGVLRHASDERDIYLNYTVSTFRSQSVNLRRPIFSLSK